MDKNIFEKIKRNHGDCSHTWCSTCPLLMSGGKSSSDNILIFIAEELNIPFDDYENLPARLCGKDIIRGISYNWRDDLFNLFNEISNLPDDINPHDYLVKKHPKYIDKLKQSLSRKMEGVYLSRERKPSSRLSSSKDPWRITTVRTYSL